MCEVQQELERLKSVFESIGQDIHLQAPATDSLINSIEAATGVAVDDRLKAFWRLSNGSDRTRWFGHPGEIVYGEDESEEGVTCLLEEGATKEMAAQWPEDFTGHYFLSVEDVLKNWSRFAPYNEAVYEEWYDDEEWGKRDKRIQRHFLKHKKWLPFAEFNGGSHLYLFDADPTSEGTFGQIISYMHDPDGIDWVAMSFLEFFKESNDNLENWLEDPEALAENLGFF